MGGASGLGLVGAAAAQASRTVGSALGFYGMAWSVYTNIIAAEGKLSLETIRPWTSGSEHARQRLLPSSAKLLQIWPDKTRSNSRG